jgi:hypothetical protein
MTIYKKRVNAPHCAIGRMSILLGHQVAGTRPGRTYDNIEEGEDEEN